ncbi:hypothetical protein SYNPS1DRAFT_13700 [Syncephalis pseudoplumigaleata]|uniref:UBR-type domain-containing protein n=1 Tax=Syncephalis pseudoplumigaleata TaxID=1712513 RepID=A0A4P9Z320_9FUNG|nr:hypothetical protein SYNPS1DRAFT_13700 [Syncephalis pseudoplumigaleata]|eukprot:RKP26778.1 hypothetical protein SYNPS1DRAFT_13700 [Syncephalis pseudoplumigaleata]
MANIAASTQDPPGNDEHTVTAVDVLQAQTALEREAAAVLPGRFDRCTRSLGPTRQSAYACLTCSPVEPRGICYACSIACHAEHNLVELFERRRFLCDCATDMPDGHGCTIRPADTSADTAASAMAKLPRNHYDHNYLGRFCRCDEAYDPDKEAGTMYQCAVCEDWFHDRCIQGLPRQTDSFEEFCCQACVARLPFLHCYALQEKVTVNKKIVKSEEEEEEEKVDVDVVNATRKRPHVIDAPSEDEQATKRVKVEDDTVTTERACPWTADVKERMANASSSSSSSCDLFFAADWRDRLCRCSSCMDIYEEADVTYLLATEETYQPEKDEDSDASLFDLGMQKLAGMDRTQAINGLYAYNQLCGEIKSFLRGFASTGKVVTKSDVETFFAVSCVFITMPTCILTQPHHRHHQ